MVIHHLGEIAGASHWSVESRHRKEKLFTNAVELFDWPYGQIARTSGLVERADKRVGN
jgi:hypothetical protein